MKLTKGRIGLIMIVYALLTFSFLGSTHDENLQNIGGFMFGGFAIAVCSYKIYLMATSED